MYAVYNGPKKIKHIAQTVNRQCNQLAESLLASGIDLFHIKFFDTIRFQPKNDWKPLAEDAKFNFRKYDDGSVGVTIDEETKQDDINFSPIDGITAIGFPLDGKITYHGRVGLCQNSVIKPVK